MRPHVLIHLAAETGTGQSLTEASRHARENVLGTAVDARRAVRHRHVPNQFVLSSSRAVYGEAPGGARRGKSSTRGNARRTARQLRLGFPRGKPHPVWGSHNRAAPTRSMARRKLAQEHILEAWALAFGPN